MIARNFQILKNLTQDISWMQMVPLERVTTSCHFLQVRPLSISEPRRSSPRTSLKTLVAPSPSVRWRLAICWSHFWAALTPVQKSQFISFFSNHKSSSNAFQKKTCMKRDFHCLSILRCLNFHGTGVKMGYQQNTPPPPHFLLFFACRKTHLCRRRSGPDGAIHIFNSHPAEL